MKVLLKKVFRKDIVATIQKKLKALRTIWRNKKYLRIPIIVYQPGKVGSITVQESLKTAFGKLNLGTPVYHAHNLDRIQAIEEFIKQARKAPENTLKKLAESKALRQEIDEEPSKKWNIISLVRDPVALRVSTMFQVLDEYIPGWPALAAENKLSIEALQDILLTREELDPRFLARWFDNQVKGLFRFDILSVPFDVEKGYTIYRPSASRFSFMIIRLEDLNRVAPQAFHDFIGLENFEIISHNIGAEKPYSALYKRFKSVPLPAEYLNMAYETQYARHFYTPQEIETFRHRWLHPEIKA